MISLLHQPIRLLEYLYTLFVMVDIKKPRIQMLRKLIQVIGNMIPTLVSIMIVESA
jgi:hypothetical protein